MCTKFKCPNCGAQLYLSEKFPRRYVPFFCPYCNTTGQVRKDYLLGQPLPSGEISPVMVVVSPIRK